MKADLLFAIIAAHPRTAVAINRMRRAWKEGESDLVISKIAVEMFGGEGWIGIDGKGTVTFVGSCRPFERPCFEFLIELVKLGWPMET